MYVCSNAVKHFANYKLRKISPGKKGTDLVRSFLEAEGVKKREIFLHTHTNMAKGCKKN